MLGREPYRGHAPRPFGSMVCENRWTACRVAGGRTRVPGAGFLACLPGRLAALRGIQGFEFVEECLQLIAVDDGLAVRPG